MCYFLLILTESVGRIFVPFGIERNDFALSINRLVSLNITLTSQLVPVIFYRQQLTAVYVSIIVQ